MFRGAASAHFVSAQGIRFQGISLSQPTPGSWVYDNLALEPQASYWSTMPLSASAMSREVLGTGDFTAT